MKTRALWTAGALLAFHLAHAAPPPVALVQGVSGLSAPVEIATAPGSPQRLFVVQRAGRIRIVENGAILPADFLDVGSLITAGGERGLLGLAFHPDYAANRAFYVYYTRSGDGAITIARYLRNATNPDVADPASGVPILVIPHPGYENHNGGRLVFGPDGLLYIGTGDGGGGAAGDPDRNAQDLASRLGKILRIAVDGGGTYTIPPGNPFAAGACPGGTGQCPEILHYGLRNPWKLGFDRANGDLLVADVGQDAREEVNHLPAGTAPGANFGWGVFEGDLCYNDTYFGSPGACANLVPRLDPVITYGHDAAGGDSITGGYVYRGTAIPALAGYYIYGDFISRRIWAARKVGDAWEVHVLLQPQAELGFVSSFGENAAGEIYIADFGNGKIWRLDASVPPAAVAFDHSGDGRADILWRNAASGLDYQWQMNGLAIVAQGYLPAAGPGWSVAGIGDLDGDGRADAFWREASGLDYAWLMAGSGIAGQGYLPTVPPPWIVAGLGDADGDGRADVFWRNPSTGQNYLWTMQGLAIASQGYLPTVAGSGWTVAGIADLNGDTRADVLWRDAATGQNYLWLMNGFAVIAQGYLPTVASADWEIAGTPDANADGKADVLWRNRATGQNYLWLMSGLTLAAKGFLPGVADTNWKIAGYGDYNGDGRGDVFWRNSTTGQNYLWLLDGLAVVGAGHLPGVADANWTPVK